MGRGLLAGAIWGALVGALVLMVAALVLDTRTDRAEAPVDAPSIAAPEPALDAPKAQPLPDGPDRAPLVSGLTGGAAGAEPPRAVARPVVLTRPDARTLLPRPLRPVLPVLVAGTFPPGALDPAAPPVTATAGVAPVTPPDPVVDTRPVADTGLRVPLAARAADPMPAPVPAAPVAAVLPARPVAPAAPPALIAGAATPPRLLSPPREVNPSALQPQDRTGPLAVRQPATLPTPLATAPPAAAGAQDAAGRALPQLDVPAPAAVLGSAAAEEAEARIALVLEGGAPERFGAVPPLWLMTATAPGVAPFRIALGGPDVDPSPDPVLYPDRSVPAGYVSDRAAGRAALLAYDRLESAGAATPERLAALAARAMRDGAVTVLVAPDPALWALIGDWLADAAPTLTPVPAAALLP